MILLSQSSCIEEKILFLNSSISSKDVLLLAKYIFLKKRVSLVVKPHRTAYQNVFDNSISGRYIFFGGFPEIIFLTALTPVTSRDSFHFLIFSPESQYLVHFSFSKLFPFWDIRFLSN